MPDAVGVTVCITTYNRRVDLERAIRSALDQRPSVPVLVFDDGSADGTSDMVAATFPDVRLVTSPNVGVLRARNECMRLAGTELVQVLDDDAYFTRPTAVGAIVDMFSDDRVAAVAIPFTEHGQLEGAPADGPIITVTRRFFGGMTMLRTAPALALGGYRESLRFYNEEMDLAIRLLGQGYVVRAGPDIGMVHEPNVDRNPGERVVKRLRNEFRFKWYHTPWPYLPPVMAHHVVKSSRELLQRRQGRRIATSLREAVADAVAERAMRDPVSMETYRMWRHLARADRPLDEIAPKLPAIADTDTSARR